ncbi:hypothetical protein OGATHE_003205 [Ogataea polymorpha]|uniref:Uncharacterized protein n=1 Tax=Ogataea polymorpha TaxID=460523 RepID=A0A9P8P964_9ASCO|nr:hypothetical protein OGATHE_003205 [Ogataea polymorpha]
MTRPPRSPRFQRRNATGTKYFLSILSERTFEAKTGNVRVKAKVRKIVIWTYFRISQSSRNETCSSWGSFVDSSSSSKVVSLESIWNWPALALYLYVIHIRLRARNSMQRLVKK